MKIRTLQLKRSHESGLALLEIIVVIALVGVVFGWYALNPHGYQSLVKNSYRSTAFSIAQNYSYEGNKAQIYTVSPISDKNFKTFNANVAFTDKTENCTIDPATNVYKCPGEVQTYKCVIDTKKNDMTCANIQLTKIKKD